MNRKKLPLAEVGSFLAELRKAGATRIRRHPADAKGLVEIRWGDTELERQRYAADMQAWRLPMALAAVVAAIIVLVLIILL